MNVKDHFSGHANIYRAARPTYPSALFEWLAKETPTRNLAWDAGCGNGQASTALAAQFSRVYASDPSAAQIAVAIARTNLEYRVERAEECSLPAASADLVTIAQALHWIDHARFYAEVRRVVKPAGLIAAWTYADCRVDTAIDAIKNRLYVDLTGPFWPSERQHVDSGYQSLPFPFEAVVAPEFRMQEHWTLTQFSAYLRSWSASQRYLKAHRVDPVDLIERELVDRWGDPATERNVSWDFHLRCGRV